MPTGRKHSFQPGLECLEDRTLLAAHLTASLTSGLLRIDGTAGADTIVVRDVRNQISVDGVRISAAGRAEASVSAAAVSRIEIFGESGNDRIFLNSEAVRGQQALTKPVTVWGGSGNDLIVAGAGAETIYGGDGNDTIYGGAGNDRIYGEGGDDRIAAGSGNTVIDGGSGRNLMVGGRGNDVFSLTAPRIPSCPAAATPSFTATTPRRRRRRRFTSPAVHGLDFSPAPAPAPFQQQVDQIIAMENAYRASRVSNTLTINSKLMVAASYQADYMARTGDYSHINLDGRGLPHASRRPTTPSPGWARTSTCTSRPLAAPPASASTSRPAKWPSITSRAGRCRRSTTPICCRRMRLQVGVAIAQYLNGNIYAAMVLGHP